MYAASLNFIHVSKKYIWNTYLPFSKSSKGAVNLAAQKQLSVGWEEKETEGGGRGEMQRVRRREWDTKAVWAHYVDFFSSSAKQKHPGTFRHTTHRFLPFFLTTQSSFIGKSNISPFTAAERLPIASVTIDFLWDQMGLNHSRY